jgi:hypothetical protein
VLLGAEGVVVAVVTEVEQNKEAAETEGAVAVAVEADGIAADSDSLSLLSGSAGDESWTDWADWAD